MQDLYLVFETRQAALDALRPLGFTFLDDENLEHLSRGGRHHALWEVGDISGVNGWHVNVRIVDPAFDVSSLEPFRVYPASPSCVWA